MRGEDDRCFLLFLRLLGDAFGTGAVQGGFGAAQEVKVRLVDQIEQPVVRFMEKTVLAPCFAEVIRRLAGGGVDEVTGQGVVVRQVVADEHLFRADFFAQRANR